MHINDLCDKSLGLIHFGVNNFSILDFWRWLMWLLLRYTLKLMLEANWLGFIILETNHIEIHTVQIGTTGDAQGSSSEEQSAIISLLNIIYLPRGRKKIRFQCSVLCWRALGSELEKQILTVEISAVIPAECRWIGFHFSLCMVF